MKKTLEKFSYPFLIILIIFLPFQSLSAGLLSKFTIFPGRIVFWLTHWYEPFILIFALIFLANYFLEKRKIKPLEIFAGAFILLGLISILFFSPTIGRGIEGFRIVALPVVVFLITYLSDFESKKKDKLVKTYLIVSIGVAFWAIVERIMPLNYWQNLGLTSSFGYGNFLAGHLQRSTSFFSGPNQLGSYLLPAFFLLISKTVITAKAGIGNRLKVTSVALSLIIAAAITFSFSRAALLGLLFGFVLYIFLIQKKPRGKITVALISVVAALASLGIYSNIQGKLKDLASHGESQYWHMVAMKESLAEFGSRSLTEKLFGHGLGTAGPIALKYHDGLISESWYLQLLLEVGLVGLALFLIFVTIILVQLCKKKSYALFSGLSALLVTSLFLHTFADNPAIIFTIYCIIGSDLSKKGQHEEDIN